MEDKTEEIVKQYPIHVNGKRRIRGAILFEAKEGIFTLIHCRESEKKLSFTEQIKMKLEEQVSYAGSFFAQDGEWFLYNER